MFFPTPRLLAQTLMQQSMVGYWQGVVGRLIDQGVAFSTQVLSQLVNCCTDYQGFVVALPRNPCLHSPERWVRMRLETRLISRPAPVQTGCGIRVGLKLYLLLGAIRVPCWVNLGLLGQGLKSIFCVRWAHLFRICSWFSHLILK